MQGYAYILTHPGTPSVFFDHVFSSYQHEICRLISLRLQKKIHCRSKVSVCYTFGIRTVFYAVQDIKSHPENLKLFNFCIYIFSRKKNNPLP
jgi:alpha-amylase